MMTVQYSTVLYRKFTLVDVTVTHSTVLYCTDVTVSVDEFMTVSQRDRDRVIRRL